MPCRPHPQGAEKRVTVRLRPHHLLCLLTYVGKGYTPAFVANMDRIVERIGAGEAIALVASPDDICQGLVGSGDDHCDNTSVERRDAAAAEEVANLLGRSLKVGTQFRFDDDMRARLSQAFAAGIIRSACDRCPWSDLCTDVAAEGFPGARLHQSMDSSIDA